MSQRPVTPRSLVVAGSPSFSSSSLAVSPARSPTPSAFESANERTNAS
jgi:hypothetical protein